MGEKKEELNKARSSEVCHTVRSAVRSAQEQHNDKVHAMHALPYMLGTACCMALECRTGSR